MNIYLHVEILSREFDSKLLLACIAASKNHEVIVSNLEGIIKGIELGILHPGIFHTKSLTPANHKISTHGYLLKRGFKITSLDEETGLDINGYEEFANTRYSEVTMDQASAVFGWGKEDTDTLKKIYDKQSTKIFKTGSPRIDLSKSIFNEYWGKPYNIPKKPYLLVSSNMGYANSEKEFFKIIKSKKNFGYYNRYPDLFKKDFLRGSDSLLKTYYFIDAIKSLAHNNERFDIVFRPHPSENLEAWKFYLKDIRNVHVIREGSIIAWIKNSFALMHNGCTTAIEAKVCEKPVVTFMPPELLNQNILPNKIGNHAKSKEELVVIVNEIFGNQPYVKNKNNIDILNEKIFIDLNELAAEKILNIWETLNIDINKKNNWNYFKYYLNFIKLRKMMGKTKKIFTKGMFHSIKENQKFLPLDYDLIQKKFSILKKILGLKNIKCELLSDYTILVKKIT